MTSIPAPDYCYSILINGRCLEFSYDKRGAKEKFARALRCARPGDTVAISKEGYGVEAPAVIIAEKIVRESAR